jgi:hypothetical protein
VQAASLALVSWFGRLWKRRSLVPDRPKSQTSIDLIKGPEVKETFALTTAEFIRLRRELKADLEDELTRADETEKLGLRDRIA